MFAETHLRADGVREPRLAHRLRKKPVVTDKVYIYMIIPMGINVLTYNKIYIYISERDRKKKNYPIYVCVCVCIIVVVRANIRSFHSASMLLLLFTIGNFYRKYYFFLNNVFVRRQPR